MTTVLLATPERLGHINSAAIRIIDEVLTPAFARDRGFRSCIGTDCGRSAERLRNYGDD